MTKCKNAQKAEEAKNVYERCRSNTDPEAKREMVNSFWLAGGKVKGLQVLTGHTPPPFPFFGVWVGFLFLWGGQNFACMPMLHAGSCCMHAHVARTTHVHILRCCMNSRWRPAKMTPRRDGAAGPQWGQSVACGTSQAQPAPSQWFFLKPWPPNSPSPQPKEKTNQKQKNPQVVFTSCMPTGSKTGSAPKGPP